MARPPRIASLILKTFLPSGIAGESIRGDIDQEFAELVTSRSLARARSWYRLETVKFAFRYGLRGLLSRLNAPNMRTGLSPRERIHRFGRDIRFAARRLARSPLFTGVAVITLALGIGANTAIFSLVNGILLTPLPFEDPDELVGIWHTAPGLDLELLDQSPALHFTYVEENRSFTDLGMWDVEIASVTGLDEPEEVQSIRVTEGIFRALRLQPAFGRIFTTDDCTPGNPRTVILSHGYWLSRFGGDRDAVGQTLAIDGTPHEIIGVLPGNTHFMDRDPAFFVPIRIDPATLMVGNFAYMALGRLKPGVTLDQANADIVRMAYIAADRYPGGATREILDQGQFDATLRPLAVDIVGDIGEVLWVLLGTVAIILLIACANVANLFLVRAESRERELAIRISQGANRTRIVGEFLRESLILSTLGAVAGTVIAQLALRLLRELGSQPLPRLSEVTLDARVLLFTLGISVAAGLLFGVFPLIKTRRNNLLQALKTGGRGGSPGREKQRTRNLLVVVQVAMALLLLVGSGLLIRSYQALRQVDPGFSDPEDVLTLRLSIPEAEIGDPQEVTRTWERLAQSIAAVPGVTCVGATSSVAMDRRGGSAPVFIEDHPTPPGTLPSLHSLKWVEGNYLTSMQIPLVAGRSVDWRDAYDLNRVVMVSENFARTYWDTPAAAIGRRISTGMVEGTWVEIVGVVADVRDYGFEHESPTMIYWPLLQEDYFGGSNVAPGTLLPQRSLAFVIRSPRTGSSTFMEEIKAAIWDVNPNLPLAAVRTLTDLMRSSLGTTTFALIMLGIAALTALILGTIGVYGVVSYIVSQRKREFGVRIALGANSGRVRALVVRRGLVLSMIGVAIGLGAALGATGLLENLLFGVNPVDPLTYAIMAAALIMVSATASYIPARRASKVDPVEAIRAE